MSVKIATSVHADKLSPMKSNPKTGNTFLGFPFWRKHDNENSGGLVDAELTHLAQAFPNIPLDVVARTLEDCEGNHLACAKALLQLTRAQEGTEFFTQEFCTPEGKTTLDEWELIDKGMDREDKDDWELVSGRLAAKTPPPDKAAQETSKLPRQSVVKVLEEACENQEPVVPDETCLDSCSNIKANALEGGASVAVGEEQCMAPAQEAEPTLFALHSREDRDAAWEQKENYAAMKKKNLRERRLQTRQFKAKITYGLACQG